MIKISAILGVLGVALLLLSLAPQPATSQAPPDLPAAPAQSAALNADAAYGRELFAAKGCVQCHHHAALAGSGVFAGSNTPDLTTYQANPTFLRTWLKDPAAVRPGTDMPNLELKEAEIEALIAFLSANKTQ